MIRVTRTAVVILGIIALYGLLLLAGLYGIALALEGGCEGWLIVLGATCAAGSLGAALVGTWQHRRS